MSAPVSDVVARARAAMEGTIAAPWFWRGNTDHDGDVELRGYKPGAGQVDVLRTCQQTLSDEELGAEWDKSDLGEYIGREDYIEQRRDNPRRHLVFGSPDAMFVEFGRELAVYEVARNQGLPDDTPRDHERVYRADVVDVRNSNARFIAAARSLVPELANELEQALKREQMWIWLLDHVTHRGPEQQPDWVSQLEQATADTIGRIIRNEPPPCDHAHCHNQGYSLCFGAEAMRPPWLGGPADGGQVVDRPGEPSQGRQRVIAAFGDSCPVCGHSVTRAHNAQEQCAVCGVACGDKAWPSDSVARFRRYHDSVDGGAR